MCVLWSLETWNRVSGTTEMALNGAVGLALSFCFVCVFLYLCVGFPVCASFLLLCLFLHVPIFFKINFVTD